MADTYLVTGGTGRIGTTFVHEMAARGATVRLGTRSPDGASAQLRAAFGPGKVEPAVLDPTDAAGLERAFAGVTGALLIPPFGDMAAWHTAMATAAKAAGVEHIVKVSVTGARGPESEPPPGRIPSAHWKGEEALRASGVPSAVIRPTIFAQHFLGLSPALFRPGDPSVHLPIGDARVAFVDCRDIAIAAAVILSEQREAWAGKAFELTGSVAVSGPEIEAILSGAGGRPIAWVDGEPAFSEHAAAIGVPDGIKAVYGEAAGGWFSEISDEAVVAITGRHPTSFAKFAYDNRAHFTTR